MSSTECYSPPVDEARIEMDVIAAATMTMRTVKSSMKSITSSVAAAVLAMVAERKRLDGSRREELVYHRSSPGTLVVAVV